MIRISTPKALCLPLAALGTLAAAPAVAQEGPPGLVFIQGERFDIGIEKKEAIKLIEDTQQRALASEYPQHSVRLDDFWYMPTEVTNEQFAAFVSATDSEPPLLWGQEAIDAATLAYAEMVGKAKKDARDAGEPMPEFEEFVPADWWQDNWVDSEWKVPAGMEDFPVVNISYERAEAYARWAGLRLISEEEHQVAGRGEEPRAFPWGEEWVEGAANCTEARLGRLTAVGSWESGASWVNAEGEVVERTEKNAAELTGIYDLCGNAWEWTRSPYAPFPDFKPLPVKIQGSKEKLTPEFDANNRVAVSGSFGLPPVAIRLTTRRGTARWQTTAGLGMRCSASNAPGRDIGESILRMDLPTSKRPDGAVYVPENIVAIDRWTSERGTAEPDSYRIITAYDVVAFMPVEETGLSMQTLLSRTPEKPVELGAFSTTVPIMEPALDPGTYTLSWRAGAEVKVVEEPAEGEGEEAGAEAPASDVEAYPFDPLLPTLIVRDLDANIVGWLVVDPPQEIRKAPGRAGIHQRPLEELSKRELDDGRVPEPAATVLTFHAMVPMSKPNKTFEFTIPFGLEPGTVDDTWRR